MPIFVVLSQQFKFITSYNLQHYWTNVRQICKRIIVVITLFISIVIFQSVLECQGAE